MSQPNRVNERLNVTQMGAVVVSLKGLRNAKNHTCGYSTTASVSAFQAEDVGSIPITRSIMVTIAQLVERRIVVPNVVGSSPTGHPKIIEVWTRILIKSS